MIPALVLTAGLATRLRPLSFLRAKAAMPVAGEPLVRRILSWLRASGVTDAVLNLHHLPHTITGRVGDGSDLGLRVRYSWEVPILGSAGGPKLASPLVGPRTFLIVNGDTLTNVPIPALVEAHQQSGALVTMAVTSHADAGKYGGVVTDSGGVVTRFAARGSAAGSRHFVGVQVVEAEAFASVPEGTFAESVAAVYPALMAERPGSVRAHECRAEFFDIGTPADYLETSLLFAGRETSRSPWPAAAQVDPTARISQSILWNDVVVGANARLHRCIVADGAHVPAGASWAHTTIRPADDQLMADERRVGDLAVGPLSGRVGDAEDVAPGG
jgi:NDP-sugar pyrophosphorylase family protein